MVVSLSRITGLPRQLVQIDASKRPMARHPGARSSRNVFRGQNRLLFDSLLYASSDLLSRTIEVSPKSVLHMAHRAFTCHLCVPRNLKRKKGGKGRGGES